MSVDAIGAIAAAAPQDMLTDSGALAPVAPAGQSFGAMVAQGIGQVNDQLMASQTQLQLLATGDVQNIHQVMIGMEEAKMSFQLLMQVRSRVLEAYQDVMKMQV